MTDKNEFFFDTETDYRGTGDEVLYHNDFDEVPIDYDKLQKQLINRYVCAGIFVLLMPYIFFIYAGAYSMDDACVQDESNGLDDTDTLTSFSLALWLTLSGALPLFFYGLASLLIVGRNFFCSNMGPGLFLLLIIAIFLAIWDFEGIYLVIISNCNETSPFLYTSAIIAIVFHVVGVAFHYENGRHGNFGVTDPYLLQQAPYFLPFFLFFLGCALVIMAIAYLIESD